MVVGSATIRMLPVKGVYKGIVIVGGQIIAEEAGDSPDDVWRRLHDHAARANPQYFGFDGARTRFLKFFPNGFQSEGFVAEERNYKLAAKAKLDENVPLEVALAGSGLGEAVLAVFSATNLLSPFEKTRLQDVLRGPAADDFIRAAASFASGGGRSALLDLQRSLQPHDSAKWTVVTYLPFLWRPEEHMFLKPEVTKDFAARVGHQFANDYRPKLDYAVYEALLDLASRTARELEDLKPRDRIDVQSFIWVVGAYKEETETPKV